jgi:uncharacterized protein YbjT (DUF2867 family)
LISELPSFFLLFQKLEEASMKVVIFGATGMVGQGALRECLLDEGVNQVVTVGRTPTGQSHPKLKERVAQDLFDLSILDPDLRGADACLFCLGVSSAGMTEAAYTRITHDLTLAVAEHLARLEPRMVFIYVSGAGTDASEHGRTMWARVKGRTENALRRLPFRRVYLLRPGFIQPLHGIQSRTAWYRVIYAVFRPLALLARALFPGATLTTESLGQAMLLAARVGAPKEVLEARDLNELVNAARIRRA